MKHVLITAGPTHEYIDPVRFIGNIASGKQGMLLAEEAIKADYRVTLVTGPTNFNPMPSANFDVVKVTSAVQMYEECLRLHDTVDICIFTAAVADYRPVMKSDKKIKRNGEALSIDLVENPDIAKELGKLKKEDQIHIGFALETNDGLDNASRKILTKNLDYIVLNMTSTENRAFVSDSNIVTIISKDGSHVSKNKMSKKDIAKEILNLIK